jgi:DNA (cytosine-5)-methyltransferase 1
MNKQLLLDVHNKLIVDLFAGGGGMSVAFENAFGRSPDIAINHNDDALSMHRMNHPLTRHFIADVYEVDPHGATQGREVGWLHLSPDCTHHSQASGGQPRSKKIRGLSWVGYRWGGQVQPDVISLENVKQILKWGPLIAKRCKVTRRVMKLDGTIAAPGEIVPVREQYLVPDPKREGQTWHKFVAALQRLGYKVEWRTLIAANFGGHTTRERLFMIARRDGLPITWPETTHFKKPVAKQKKWKPAADCIDFSDLGKSIFTRPKPLAPATLRRIAKGMKRYVIDSIKPFIVPIAHYNGTNTVHSIDEPLRTITSATKGGEFAVATPIIAKFRHDSAGRSIEEPMPTVTSGGDCARPAGAAHALGLVAPVLVPATHQGADRVHSVEEPLKTITAAHRGETMLAAPVLVQAAHGEGTPGKDQRWGAGSRDIQEPMSTITGSGGQAIAAATLVQTGYGERDGQSPRSLDIEAPLGTVVGSGKHAVASAILAGVGGRAGQSEPKGADEPMNTVTAKADTAVVTAKADTAVVTAKADTAVVTAYMMQANDGFNTTVGRELSEPMTTITNSGSQQQLVTAHLAHLRGNCDARDLDDPLQTVSAGGQHHGLVSAFLSSYYTDDSNRCRDADDPMATITTENRIGLVECVLSPEEEAGALRVAAFLMEYYSEGGQWSELDKPLNTITTKDRLALVTVFIQGTPYVIVDIRLRMLKPRELFNGQDFPASYIIDRGHDGRRFSISAQVRMCGNSVDPAMATPFLAANAPWLAVKKAA